MIHLLTADISWSFVVYVAHVNLLITLSFYNHKTDTCNFLKRRERKLVKNYFILQYLKTFLCFHKLRVWTMEMTSRWQNLFPLSLARAVKGNFAGNGRRNLSCYFIKTGMQHFRIIKIK